MNILYPVIDGEITGGNIVCLRIIEESLRRGYKAIVNSPTRGRFTRLLKEKGIKVYDVDTRRTFHLSSAIKLARIIKKESVDLIHSHAPLAATVLSRLAGCLAGVPVVNHLHAPYCMNPNPFIRSYQFLLNWITSRVCCSKDIAVSEFVKREVVKQGSVVSKIAVIYNGINLQAFRYSDTSARVREEFNLNQNKYIVGEIARLGEDKGQHILIKAAQKVLQRIPGAAFMLVGEDLTVAKDYQKLLRRMVNELGLEDRFIFTGYRPDIADLVNIFDIFVLPSTAAEGLPLVILEAMAARKSVIASRVGGNSEVIIDAETGTLVPPNDPDRLAAAIIYHLTHPEISKQMGGNGYERLRQHFSLSRMLEKVMDVYREVLNV
jgi:glycosyltransferase involved in cell wall biosynthesis